MSMMEMKQQPLNLNVAKLSLALTLLSVLVVTCVGAFSILWIQQEIAKVAKDTVVLERKHEELLRKLDHLDKRITDAHQPVAMQSRVSHRLYPLKDAQVVWVEAGQVLKVNSYAEAQNSYQRLMENNL